MLPAAATGAQLPPPSIRRALRPRAKAAQRLLSPHVSEQLDYERVVLGFDGWESAARHGSAGAAREVLLGWHRPDATKRARLDADQPQAAGDCISSRAIRREALFGDVRRLALAAIADAAASSAGSPGAVGTSVGQGIRL